MLEILVLITTVMKISYVIVTVVYNAFNIHMVCVCVFVCVCVGACQVEHEDMKVKRGHGIS